jgi:chromosomal replication initiator protein
LANRSAPTERSVVSLEELQVVPDEGTGSEVAAVAAAWEATKADFGEQGLSAHDRAWIRGVRAVGMLEQTVLFSAPNEIIRDLLDHRFRPLVISRMSAALGRPIDFAVIVRAAPDPDILPEEPQDEQATRLASVSSRPGSGGSTVKLNQRYTFETFVIGDGNRFPHAAAVAVAEAPGRAYNPLFIYGDSGLGKTHLLHAIAHDTAKMHPELRVCYVNSEEFTNEFINAIRDDRQQQFRTRYRDVDILLIDDIQFLENKERTQEEFFHTFNDLHGSSRQIVISSDRPPKQLSTLEDRLRSRFEWGLITDVSPPDLETRIAILSKKAAAADVDVDFETLTYIATHIERNIRELEGALIRVAAFASLQGVRMDQKLAEAVLRDLIPDASDPEITAAVVMSQTAGFFGVSMDELCGSSRSRSLVMARQIAMYLCRELTDLSLPKIGAHFGGRDHTTVIHANRKIEALMAEKRQVYNQVTELHSRIRSKGR